MDNLVLIRVAATLDRQLRHSALMEARAESRHRFKLLFDSDQGIASVVVSLRPEKPWIGRPAGRWEGPKGGRTPFARTLARSLKGALVASVEKAAADRVLTIGFAGGRALVAELATHGANLVLLDGEGMVVASAKRPRSALDRLTPGKPYSPPRLPKSLLNPFEADAGAIDYFLKKLIEEGGELLEAVRRRLFGVGSRAAELVVDESARTGESIGSVLRKRLDMLQRGELDPVILEGEEMQLLPWPPYAGNCVARQDPAATAGFHYETSERRILLEERKKGLHVILAREAQRLFRAERGARRDLELFEDPEKHKRWGEALLAGIGQAERVGEIAMVPDPYDPEGGDVAVPVKPGIPLQTAVDDHFQRYRKAERGLEQARSRVEALAAKRRRLKELQQLAEVEELEQAMRREGLPVALQPATRAGRAAATVQKPRLEGVRIFTSSDGIQIMAGRSGKENHRLTFKLATPEDFWFHALGRPGAHVVARNEERASRPPQATLEEAAAVAAWFSEASRDEFVDVQWTRRKYVRKPRGAKPGTVILKKFQTVRVRPGLPGSELPL
jgi:predicted ribosome quality control (RQC) complex YloA/Tae2 family protein